MIDEDTLKRLQQIARDRVFEPFEGRKSLETLQKTRSGLEKGLVQVKEKSAKTGKWLQENRFAKLTKKKVSGLMDNLKEKQSSSGINEWIQKLDDATEEFQQFAKGKYEGLDDKARKLTATYIEKGLELLLFEELDNWIPKKASKILESSDINTLDDVKQLSIEDKQKLVDVLYPYNSSTFTNFSQSFDSSLNVSLGAIVASNFPGTGLMVSLINMGKTLVKLGNRLNTMSAIHGTQIANPQSLFKTSAQILQSMEDWENNEKHLPLDPQILVDLYRASPEGEETAFEELLEQVVKKEAYIAIPGVGMISLGKINLDDIKMDIVVEHLVENYFALIEISELLGENVTIEIIEDFALIYKAFIEADYFKVMRPQQEDETLEKREQKWKVRMKLFAGIDLALENSSMELDQFVRSIFDRIQALSVEEKKSIIEEEVNCILD